MNNIENTAKSEYIENGRTMIRWKKEMSYIQGSEKKKKSPVKKGTGLHIYSALV